MREKLKKLSAYYKPYLKLFYSDMFFAVSAAAISLILPLIVRYITREVVYFAPNEALKTILLLGAVMLGLVFIELGCNFFITYYGHLMGVKMEADMRSDIFGHYQKLSFTFFDNQKVGQLLSRITNDLFDISELLHHGPEDLVVSLLKFIGSFAILLTVNARLALMVFAFIPAMVVFACKLNGKMKRAFKKNREKIAEINGQIEDSLSGIRVVKSFGNEKEEIKKFESGNHNYVLAKRNSYKYAAIYNSGLGAMSTLVTVAVVVGGVSMLVYKKISVTDLITFILYIPNFTDPIRKLVAFTEQFQNGITGFERFQEILSVHPDIADEPGAVSVDKVKGKLEFKDVSFAYEKNQEEVLHGMNLTVDEGEYVAMVGASGVGKTTLCSLIPRFYEVSHGAIYLDGTDIRHIKLKSLRSHIGIVQQDVYLFAGNITENIRYGKPDATDEEVIRAAKNANAHDFIMSFPDGYDTYIGQRGVKLSGGQKQRLSIARVFLKNPEILIFDEATSALDNESEKIVQESMEKLAKDRTTFVIAHRLSTIRNAKRIIVLTGGGIAEEGTHDELIAKQGEYAELYQMQFRHDE